MYWNKELSFLKDIDDHYHLASQLNTILRDIEGKPKPLGFGGESGAILLFTRNERRVANAG